MRRLLAAACLALPLAASAQQHAGHAHTHGQARLDVALDGGQLSLALEVPLDSLVGFERAPRTAQERARVDAVLAGLRAADGLVRPNPEAGCRLAGVELNSAALKLGPAASSAAPDDGHADLDADLRFDCTQPERLRRIDLDLFKAWPRLQRVDVQVALPSGQLKRTLKRPDGRLSLERP
ncbi:putative zinc-binding protein [Piscinibacter sakaiensis]|uniref:Putative zinc-binding protein n=1 Tax=Piscinibacter sakaiensis TaxID=1547922 RepID=A0A0K8P9M8_PISS1|nr:putative zinc-binding protein [Piscinibacter sakaiensis]